MTRCLFNVCSSTLSSVYVSWSRKFVFQMPQLLALRKKKADVVISVVIIRPKKTKDRFIREDGGSRFCHTGCWVAAVGLVPPNCFVSIAGSFCRQKQVGKRREEKDDLLPSLRPSLALAYCICCFACRRQHSPPHANLPLVRVLSQLCCGMSR